MKKDERFIERRREYRLPYSEKIIFTNGQRSLTAYALNVSRGGIFAKSLDPFPIDTHGHIAFCLPNHPQSFCVKAKVAHIVFDRQRCEVECGMGFMFMELNESQKSIMNLHVLNEQRSYQEIQKILNAEKLDRVQLALSLKKMPQLMRMDLLDLRYRVNRICTLFEVPADPRADDEDAKISA